ncbi:ABC transporter permease [Cohnella caldifontis]|uniref:ABC transporter permease n=1 Tax=Cohnella caldifontis TaxID=3027471 RepID=UPI0023EAFD3D|nr:ABC transporter permease [Cohnella sp. YIM B05605]
MMGTDKSASPARRLPLSFSPTVVAFAVLLLVWVITAVSIDGFATKASLIQTLQTAAFLGIIAAGQTIVVMMAGIDLSVSSTVTLSSVAASSVMAHSGMGPYAGIAAGLGIGAAVGLVNALGIAYLKLPPLIMTIATISLITGFMLIATNGTPPSGMSPVLNQLANNDWFFGLPNVVFIWLVVSVFTYWFLHLSKFGRQTIALGTNEKASVLSGVHTAKLQMIGYSLCGLFAGLSGILQLGYMGSTYLTLGEPYQLLSIAAVVLGGTSILGGRGNYLGTIAGTLLIIILKNVLTVIDISSAGREFVMGLLILVILFAYARERKIR